MIQNNVAKLAIALYILLLLISPLILATAGDLVPLYAFMCVLGVLPALVDRRSIRIWALPMVCVGALLVFSDWRAGLKRGDVRRAAQDVYIQQLLDAAAKAPTTATSGRHTSSAPAR
jgi:hypothetical protein